MRVSVDVVSAGLEKCIQSYLAPASDLIFPVNDDFNNGCAEFINYTSSLTVLCLLCGSEWYVNDNKNGEQ